MKLKIIGKGTRPIQDWSIVNADTGEILEGVKRISFDIDPNEGCISVDLQIRLSNKMAEIEVIEDFAIENRAYKRLQRHGY